MGAQETAQANVALKYDPQQAALERALAANKGETAANEAGIQAYGTQGRTAIGGVYDTLGSLLGANRADSATALQQQVANIGRGYDTADAVAAQAAQQGRDRISRLAQQLGQQGAELQVMNPLEALVANLTGRSQQERAAATGNLGTWAAQWDQILGQGQNIGEQSRAKALSDLEAAIARMLGENKVTGLKGENELQGRMADLLGSRQNDLIAMYERLAQQEWQNQFQQAQLDQDANKANASLALEREKMNMSAAQANADRASRSSAASQAGQLSLKDLINMSMGMQEREEAQADKQYARGIDERDYQFKRMMALQGDPGPDGNQLLMDWQTKLTGAGNAVSPAQLQQQADFFASMGYPVDFYNQPSSVAQQEAAARSSGGRGETGNSGGGFSFNPFNGLENMIRGFNLGKYR